MLRIIIGYGLDLIIGDPYWLFHPVRWIGQMISGLESKLRKQNDTHDQQRMKGILLVCLVVCTAYTIPWLLLKLAGHLSFYLAVALEAFMIFQILATRSLDVETRKVYTALKKKDMEGARKAISYLVSRDTKSMTEEEILKACIETIAENLADGVVAPMCFVILGGAPLGWLYKSVNTMDSMVGYKNEKYQYFGRCAARVDDVLNYIPARLSALFILIASFLLRLDVKNAWRMMVRDRHNHSSPNSAYPESVVAGALNVQLGGKATYFGHTTEKPTMGDYNKPLVLDDLRQMKYLLYVTSFVALTILMAIKLGVRT